VRRCGKVPQRAAAIVADRRCFPLWQDLLFPLFRAPKTGVELLVSCQWDGPAWELRSGLVMAKKVKKVPFDPKVFLATIDSGRSISFYRKDEVIFSQGKPADSVFYIQKGKVKITVVSRQGKEAVVAVLGPDEFCGEGCLAGQPRRMAGASAMTECEIMKLEKAAIIRILHKEPSFSEMFVSHLLARTIRVEEDLVDQLFNSSEKRLARALLLLANFGKEGRPESVIAKISQETLAEMIGTTRSRVSFFMNRFRKMGLINYNGHLEIHSSLLNVVLHDDPHINR
jgi:CRP/FNR family transcriptional regulator, cyclic AMP receptor protein